LKGVVQEQAADIETRTFKVSLQKVGPGVFFALFGACTIISVVATKVSLEEITSSDDSGGYKKIAYMANPQGPWGLRFVATANTLEQQSPFIRRALHPLNEQHPQQVLAIESAISELAWARQQFLRDTFPAPLRDACRNQQPVPKGFTQDHCQLFADYQNAIWPPATEAGDEK